MCADLIRLLIGAIVVGINHRPEVALVGIVHATEIGAARDGRISLVEVCDESEYVETALVLVRICYDGRLPLVKSAIVFSEPAFDGGSRSEFAIKGSSILSRIDRIHGEVTGNRRRRLHSHRYCGGSPSIYNAELAIRRAASAKARNAAVKRDATDDQLRSVREEDRLAREISGVLRDFVRFLCEVPVAAICNDGPPHLNNRPPKTLAVMAQDLGLAEEGDGLENADNDEHDGGNREHSSVVSEVLRVVREAIICTWWVGWILESVFVFRDRLLVFGSCCEFG